MNVQKPSAMQYANSGTFNLRLSGINYIKEIYEKTISKLPQVEGKPHAWFVIGPLNEGKTKFIAKMKLLCKAHFTVSLNRILALLNTNYLEDCSLNEGRSNTDTISYFVIDFLKQKEQTFFFDVHPSYPVLEQTLNSLKKSGYVIHIYDINTEAFSTLLPVYKQYSEVIGRYYQEQPELEPVPFENLYKTENSSDWCSEVLDPKLLDKVKEEEKERGSP